MEYLARLVSQLKEAEKLHKARKNQKINLDKNPKMIQIETEDQAFKKVIQDIEEENLKNLKEKKVKA